MTIYEKVKSSIKEKREEVARLEIEALEWADKNRFPMFEKTCWKIDELLLEISVLEKHPSMYITVSGGPRRQEQGFMGPYWK